MHLHRKLSCALLLFSLTVTACDAAVHVVFSTHANRTVGLLVRESSTGQYLGEFGLQPAFTANSWSHVTFDIPSAASGTTYYIFTPFYDNWTAGADTYITVPDGATLWVHAGGGGGPSIDDIHFAGPPGYGVSGTSNGSTAGGGGVDATAVLILVLVGGYILGWLFLAPIER